MPAQLTPAQLTRKREIERISQRKRRSRLFAAGLCIQCGRRNSTEHRRCAMCCRGRPATQAEWDNYCTKAIDHAVRWPCNLAADGTLLDDPEIDAFVERTIVRLAKLDLLNYL